MIRSTAQASANIPVIILMTAAVLVVTVLLQAGTVSSTNVEVLYAPNDAPLDRIVTLYQQAKRYVYVSVYGLTYPRAVEALVAAKKTRGGCQDVNRPGTDARSKTAQRVADLASCRNPNPRQSA